MAATKRVSRRAGRRRPTRAKASRKAARSKRKVRASARRRPAKKTAARTKKAAPRRKKATKKVARRKAAPKRQARATGKRRPASRPAARVQVRRDAPPSVLARSRRQLPEEERMAGSTAELVPDRMMQAARAGHDEMRNRLRRHTETSPELTAGDPDANWEDAYAVGDEAPGGDNPTPDQDRVDDIGKALGIQYRDDQELKGGDEVRERDRRRWELDPASSDDWPHDKKKK